jgi:hypothetical protein
VDEVDLTGGIAVRTAGLCLLENGKLADWSICSDAVRAGLLLDLALTGRIAHTAESIEVDPTPTGFLPADRLLAAVAAEPERSLDDWLGESRIGLRDLVEANEASGRWQRQRLRFRRDRFVDLHEAQAALDLVREPTDPPDGWTVEDACVTAIAGASGLLDPDRDFFSAGGGWPVEPSEEVLAATGPVAWLCAAAVDHLRRTVMNYRVYASGLRIGDIGPG